MGRPCWNSWMPKWSKSTIMTNPISVISENFVSRLLEIHSKGNSTKEILFYGPCTSMEWARHQEGELISSS